MNERYLFRGKRSDNGEWVQGLPNNCNNKSLIITQEGIDFDDEFYAPKFWWVVDYATIGQCTGLRDINGKLIFEGDIVCYGVTYERKNPIVFEQGCFQLFGSGGLCPLIYHHLIDSNTIDVKIIGNIHDNPELMEGAPK